MTSAPLRRLSRSVTQLLPGAVALAGLLMMPTPGSAQCEVGGKAGSSLLFPFFEVDLSSDAGLTGLISLNNESNTATMTRVIVWTDWGIPVLAFDVYLLPRDVQTMNIRDLLNGVIPSTGTGADLSSFTNCNVVPPFHANPALAPLQSSQLKAYLTGVPGPGDALCAGESYGDNHARGYITVDDQCRTNVPGIWALGDVNGRGAFTHTSWNDYEIVAANLLEGNHTTAEYAAIPSVAFTVPPLASVGLREDEARAHGLRFAVKHQDTAGWYSSRRLGEEASAFKVIVEDGTGRILGAHLLGPHADETINLFSLAMRAGVTAAAGVELALPRSPFTAGLRFEQGLTTLVPGARDRAVLFELGVDWR